MASPIASAQQIANRAALTAMLLGGFSSFGWSDAAGIDRVEL